jgi:hypothetical protein
MPSATYERVKGDSHRHGALRHAHPHTGPHAHHSHDEHDLAHHHDHSHDGEHGHSHGLVHDGIRRSREGAAHSAWVTPSPSLSDVGHITLVREPG